MKKTILAIMIATVMMATAMCVGASEENLEGVWYLGNISQDGQTLDADILSSMGMNMVLTLNSDGTATLDAMGTKNEGFWTADGTININDSDVPYTLQDGNLILEQDGQVMKFSREAAETDAFSLAPAVENPELNDFDGEWKAVLMVSVGIQIPMDMVSSDISLVVENGKVILSKSIVDQTNGGEVLETMEVECDSDFIEDSELYVDFDGADVFRNYQLEKCEGMYLTLHEDGKMSGVLPDMDSGESSGESSADQNESADDTTDGEEDVLGTYLVFERVTAASEESAEEEEQFYNDDSYSILNMQIALNEAGYDCGTPDGSLGPKTLEAMKAYQEDQGLPVTTDVTASLLISLNVLR